MLEGSYCQELLGGAVARVWSGPIGRVLDPLVSADEALYDVSIAYGTPQPFCRYGNDAEVSLEASSLPLSVSGTEIDRDAF